MSTASRVLNGGKPVSPDLGARVRAAAAELGYVADVSAGALRGRHGLLAILADELGVEALAEFASSVLASATAAGLTTTVSAAGCDAERQLDAVRVLRAMRPRAILLTGGWVSNPVIRDRLEEELHEYVACDGGRVVVMGPPEIAFASVGFDDRGVGFEMGRHMAAGGAGSALILTGPHAHRGFRERTEGFAAGLAEHGVENVRLVPSENESVSADAALRSALNDSVPDLILAVSDRIAVAAYAALADFGLRIPEDVRVSGVDDLAIASDLVPGLTTVRQPFREAGTEAVRALLQDELLPVHDVQLRGELVVRGSSRRESLAWDDA